MRLVKGAYWDSEIKRAQERGLAGYPVFTRKVNTDVSYLACARELIAAGDAIYPQFATHNAQTVATIARAGARRRRRSFEFQRLHGMGEELYAQIVGADKLGLPCRVYAPVGSHEDLLPYLVRRLLENGANTSFVNRIVDEQTADRRHRRAIRSPRWMRCSRRRIRAFRRRGMLYGSTRLNSRGVNLADPAELRRVRCADVAARRARALARRRRSSTGKLRHGRGSRGAQSRESQRGHRHRHRCRRRPRSRPHSPPRCSAQPDWDATPASERAEALERAADLFEAHVPELVAYCVREGGRTIPDSISEVREAVDFLRYYADRARSGIRHRRAPARADGREQRAAPARSRRIRLHQPVEFSAGDLHRTDRGGARRRQRGAREAGRADAAHRDARGPVAARGRRAGGCAAFLPGDGASVGARIVADPRVAGVAFTGSTETAHAINRSLANRDGADSGADRRDRRTERDDRRQLGAARAGRAGRRAVGLQQRRPALLGAARAVRAGRDRAARAASCSPATWTSCASAIRCCSSTDVGPVIDEACARHAARARARDPSQRALASRLQARRRSTSAARSSRRSPSRSNRCRSCTREVFGRSCTSSATSRSDLDEVIDAINATGYGLTLGVHTRVDATARYIASRVRAGNVYVNRNMIGAVVGVQPFGGRGLSGTGPKAGGPHYLHRFATEQTVTINTAAVGGNASLLTMDD